VADHRNELNDDRLIVAILRLQVSGGGALQYGEAIDAETEQARRFMTWDVLVDQLRALAAEASGRRGLAARDDGSVNGACGSGTLGDSGKPIDRSERQ